MSRPVSCSVALTMLLLFLFPLGDVVLADLLYGLLTDQLSIGDSSPSQIDIVDPSTFSSVGSFSVGNRAVASLAVSPDRATLYVADFSGGEIAVYSSAGSLLGNVPVSAPRDLVLSSDGTRLYVTSGTSIVEVDTTTRSVAGTLPTGSDIMLAIALSRDGTMLAATSTQGGTNPALHLIDAATLSLDTRIAITHPTLTARQVADVTFTDTGRALVWDNDRDALYQFDVAGGTQLTSDTITLTPDSGASFNFNNALHYSTLSERAYVHRDTPDELAVFDPSAKTSSTLGGFSASPFASALSSAEDKLFVSVFDAGNSLDVLDTATGTFTRGVYSFGQRVRALVVAPPRDLHWINHSGGAWDTASNWDPVATPNETLAVLIDPDTGVTVIGPAATATVKSLSIGAQAGGTATLALQSSGTLFVNETTTIGTRGELTGAGTFDAAGGITNDGQIDLGTAGLQLVGGTLSNHGVIRGNGRIGNTLSNGASGEVRVGTGRRMVFTGSSNANAGHIEVVGGEVEFRQGLTNQISTGLISGSDATLRFGTGLTNHGSLGMVFGTTYVSGDVDNLGTTVVSGNGDAVFFDDVNNNGTFQVSGGSTVVFFGAFSGSQGTIGTGTVFEEGDLRPGNSAAAISFGGDLVFGAAAGMEIELGGYLRGDEYDAVDVAGTAMLNGAIRVSVLGGFVPAPGDEFPFMTYGSRTGRFDPVVNGSPLAGLLFDVDYDDSAGTATLTAEAALFGDVDLDGDVDAADLEILLAGFGQTGDVNWLDGDISGNGRVDDEDLNLLLSNFGEKLPSALPAFAVPEPGTLVLSTLAALALMPFFGRRRRLPTDCR